MMLCLRHHRLRVQSLVMDRNLFASEVHLYILPALPDPNRTTGVLVQASMGPGVITPSGQYTLQWGRE